MKPVLILVPGFLNDSRVWADVADRLGGDADVRIADVGRQSSMAAMAGDAWALAAAVPAATPVVVCGFSMGGYVAIEMAVKPVRQLGALALIDTSSRPEAAENIPVREKTVAALQKDIARTVEGLLALNLHPESLQDAALVERVRRMMIGVGAATAARQVQAIVGRADHRALLALLELPALVLCAHDDKVLPPALSRETAALLRNSTLTLIDGAGHLTPVERPDAVAAAVRELLGRVAA